MTTLTPDLQNHLKEIETKSAIMAGMKAAKVNESAINEMQVEIAQNWWEVVLQTSPNTYLGIRARREAVVRALEGKDVDLAKTYLATMIEASNVGPTLAEKLMKRVTGK